MKKHSLAVVAVVSVLTACGGKNPSYPELVSQQWIAPAYQQLADSTAVYAQQLEAACADQQLTADELLHAQQGWRQTMQAWQQAQLIHFGPVEQNNLRWLYQFWPDLHNNIRRKVQPLLAQDNQTDTEKLLAAGVVARGFTALEYVLFDAENQPALFAQGSDSAQSRCAYLQVAAQDIAHTSATLNKDWQKGAQYRAQFDHPADNNAVFPRAKDVQAAMLDSVVAQLEVIRNDKLAGPLGLKTARTRPNPYLAEAWRSQTSLQWLAVNLQALDAVLLHSDYGLIQQVDDAAQRAALNAQLQQQVQAVQQALSALQQVTLTEALKNNQQQLQTLHDAWQALLQTVKQQLPKALGVTLGFNANDGD